MKNRKEQKHVFLFDANLLGNNRMHVIDAMAIFTFFCTIFSRYYMPNIFAITFASAFFGTTKRFAHLMSGLVTSLIFSETLSISTTLHSCEIWFWFFVWNINLLIIFHLHSQICTENGTTLCFISTKSRHNRGWLSSVSNMAFQFLATWAAQGSTEKKLGQL